MTAGREAHIWKAELRADTRSLGEPAEGPAELVWLTAGLLGNPACPQQHRPPALALHAPQSSVHFGPALGVP